MRMRLSTRLTMFFLAAQAVVLVGFSVSLYLLASKYLNRQADERLEAARNTRAAAAEVNESGVVWEPDERSLSFGRRAVVGGFLWRVADDRGRPIDGPGAGPADRDFPRPSGGQHSRHDRAAAARPSRTRRAGRGGSCTDAWSRRRRGGMSRRAGSARPAVAGPSGRSGISDRDRASTGSGGR